ncbi:MAG: imidazole glycerol phosphate synthase subunit HisH [Gammaproteobacteria bacterium]|nr:imidazole glycerol phosphate synthase subunit HisH [Gammaproteobacteria bacterium]NIO26640.1 imidazole glycerol phosphate synthase subunit HisH [Gammaproteobacteria bacterium]NIO67193.1 imidazole glycerol phosphate synthase subunit HisH [Gammaproteobacteria bacterium]NIP47244.1 imidazole glycerol phosphate synthase subunit HisH [Gammaproteobacteria bacterium]NIP66347.1 imidazole glycerol phosphate synthase subunit HisH [Gammaproteobacteria bacterium]
MQRIAVVDYGMGNLRSVAKALDRVCSHDQQVLVTSDADAIANAERVVFPGQGAIRDCMRELARLSLEPVLRACIDAKPFLGICLGLQALMESSEEHAETRGLGILAGEVRRFPADMRHPVSGERLKVPHMGWNTVAATRDHPLWHGIAPQDRFYFVHSYYVAPKDQGVVAARTRYGIEFCCAAAFGSAFAVQFHPEKSQRAGLALLANFCRWDGRA